MATASQIDTWKSIIAELCVGTNDSLAKKCLRLYDPEQPSEQLKKIFNSSKCSKEMLLQTLSYLEVKHVSKLRKGTLVDSFINRIQNLFPEICQICKEEYCHTLTDEPFLSCKLCGQEVHQACYETVLHEIDVIETSRFSLSLC